MKLRCLLAVMLALSSTAVTARADRFKPLPPSPQDEPKTWEQYLRLTDHLEKNPPYLTADRLPKGYRIGRCLLEVHGRTYVSGKCAYSISKGGAFEFHGPRQVYGGVDLPDASGTLGISTDYFVQVDRELNDDGTEGPGWDAFWNEDKRATHAQAHLGPVTRKGACYTNQVTRICLWKS